MVARLLSVVAALDKAFSAKWLRNLSSYSQRHPPLSDAKSCLLYRFESVIAFVAFIDAFQREAPSLFSPFSLIYSQVDFDLFPLVDEFLIFIDGVSCNLRAISTRSRRWISAGRRPDASRAPAAILHAKVAPAEPWEGLGWRGSLRS